jgi:DNA polymerase-3 subunit epsilon
MSLNLFDGLPNPLFGKPFAVIDFETTGLYPAVGDEIVEIGCVRVENGKLGRTYSQLVNPGRDMDPAAAQVSGIDPESLLKEPPFEQVADDFLDHLKDCVIVAHNAEFDMAFLQYKLVRLKRNQLPNPVLDTLEIARAADEGGPNTLGILANRLGIEGPHAHRALDDAVMCAKVLVHYLEEFHRQGKDDLTALPGYRHSYQFSIDGPGRGDENSFRRVVDRIRSAIESKGALEIHYKGGSKQSVRIITPRYIKGMNVRAHCHKRREDRDFRLDRILEVEAVDEAPAPAPETPGNPPPGGSGQIGLL